MSNFSLPVFDAGSSLPNLPSPRIESPRSFWSDISRFSVLEASECSLAEHKFEDVSGFQTIDELQDAFASAQVELVLNADRDLSTVLADSACSADLLKEILFRLLEVTPARIASGKGSLIEHFDSIFPQDSNYSSWILRALEESGYDAENLLYDRVASSGQGLKGRAEKIAIVWKHHFDLQQPASPILELFRDVDMLTSRLGDREMNENMVIHLRDGVYYVDRIFADGGAYVSILRGMEEGLLPKIVCRGTALRRNATGGYLSVVNDLNPQIGQLGVQRIWPDLAQYLSSEGISTLEIYGKSLGGAQAQVLTVLIEGHGITVNHLVTNCSVGSGKGVNTVLKEKILPNREAPLHVTVLRNGGLDSEGEVDYYPLFGGEHLGAGIGEESVRSEVYYLAPKKQLIETPQLSLSQSVLLRRFSQSLKAHSRQTTLNAFHWKKIDPAELEMQLYAGDALEGFRTPLVKVLSLFLPSSLQQKAFEEYFEAQRDYSANQ